MIPDESKGPEKLQTIRQLSDVLGLPYWKLLRFSKAGAFPIYRVGNQRALVRLSEVLAAVDASARSV